jgi:DNA polymerase-3 subunit epsilon
MTTQTTNSPFGNRSFCLVDIETTGLHATQHEITEIAVIRVNEHFEIADEMSRLVRIAGEVPWHITQITGITDGLLRAEGHPLSVALEEAYQFISGLNSYAHNARFDQRFLNAFASHTGKPFRFSLDCSMPIFKQLLPKRKSYSLPVLAEHLQVKGGGAHRALEDCRVLLECLRKAHGISASVCS